MYNKLLRIASRLASEISVNECPVSLVNMTLSDLGVLDTDNEHDRKRIDALKADPTFSSTGRIPREYDRDGYNNGIWIVKDDEYDQISLTDGRHRFKAAKELGLNQIWGRVQDAETREFIYQGWIPI